METKLVISILMPCLNEAETIGDCITMAEQWLTRNQIVGEVVIADNGSSDGSQEIAQNLGARVVNIPERGYGAALYYGTLSCRGKYIVTGDADSSYDFSALDPFLEKLSAGYDLVVGNRFLGGIQKGAMPFLNRYVGNPLLSGLGQLFFRAPIRDFHCGLRAYTKEAFERMDLQTSGMEFASEMVVKAVLSSMRITEVPTTLRPDGRSRPPHLKPWSDGWRHLRFMLLYSPDWLFLYPGLTLMSVGITAVVAIALGPIAIHGIIFDVHTMLYAAGFVLIGFNSIFFAALATVFGAREGLTRTKTLILRFLDLFKLEQCLVIGGILLISGLAGTTFAWITWMNQNFGALVPSAMMRVVIPSLLILLLGFELILAGFLMSLLQLPTRKRASL